jgi:predicted RNA binding protein YcfA (HicA-like mRNA interferase family)
MPRLTPIHWKRLECIFFKAGFQFVRQAGDHRSYTKKGVKRPIVIPTYDSIDAEIIKSNMRTAEMSRDQYFEYLKQC